MNHVNARTLRGGCVGGEDVAGPVCPQCVECEAATATFNVRRAMDDALMVARRATFDPGQFTQQALYHAGEAETLERWQARAVLVALMAIEPDDRWPFTTAPHVTEYERVELERVGLIGLAA